VFTTRGLLALLVAAPLFAAGTWIPSFEWIAGGYLLVCLALFWLDSRRAGGADRFGVERLHDARLSLGADNTIRLQVYNRAASPAVFWVRDETPERFEVGERVLAGEAGSRKTWEGSYAVRPTRRGDYTFGDVHLRWLGPLGLVIRQGVVPLAAGVKVYPNLLDIRRYDVMLRQNRLQEMGLRHTRLFGQGTEFERLREYQPDDDYRRIDWKATARRIRPITVEYQTERSQNIFLALDVGRMMQSPVRGIAKLDYVINAALLLAYVAAGKGDKIGLMSFGDQVENFVSPRQGRGQFYRLLELLYRVEPQPVEPDYRMAFSYLALKQRKRSLVVIFTDISGGFGVQYLVSSLTALKRASLPLVVTISDPEVHAAAGQVPADSLTAYQTVAAAAMLEERQLTLDLLQKSGALTLDVPANQLSLAVINRYLLLKEKLLL